VTRASLHEYAAIQRERYRRAGGKKARGEILTEVVRVTGIHRKAAIRLLRREAREPGARPRAGRPRHYGPEVARVAAVVWEASGYIGAHRLHPFVAELRDRLQQHGELAVRPEHDKQLRQASRATLSRLLAGARAQRPPRAASTTRVGSWLKHEIPIRTFAEWDDARPGFAEVDLVAHCGGTTKGFYLCTLCAVDVKTAWVELQAVWGKGQQRVRAAVHHVRGRWPVLMQGLDSDNGSEFINAALLEYCRQYGITFTRSRAGKKNDSAHVEQKNGAVVRALVGYDRFASRAAYAQLARVYELARLHVNFFQPTQKLVHKSRDGAHTHRVYDTAQTPFQRVCAVGELTAARRQELARLYEQLHPLRLRRDLEAALQRLWGLAVPPTRESAGGPA
jgi:hypothetical protein